MVHYIFSFDMNFFFYIHEHTFLASSVEIIRNSQQIIIFKLSLTILITQIFFSLHFTEKHKKNNKQQKYSIYIC